MPPAAEPRDTRNDDNTRSKHIDTLRSLFPTHSRSRLARYLDAARNDLERAFRAVATGQDIVDGDTTSKLSRKRARVQEPRRGRLDQWVRRGGSESAEREPAPVLVLSDSDDDDDDHDASRTEPKPPRKSAFDVLRAPAPSTRSAPAPAPAPSPFAAAPTPPAYVSLPPLTLSTPALVAHHTGGLVTLVEDALPPELAARLFVRLVSESRGEGPTGDGPWTKNKWYLVDREVESPHTSCFYREAPERLAASSSSSRSSGYDPAAFDESAQYWYNGAHRSARAFTRETDEARELVGEVVRVLMRGRERREGEWEGGEGEGEGWRPNVAVANCYRGGQESVGFHSDVLQYLGPFPTIASLTLGVTRPFRLRPFLPSRPPPPGVPPPQVRTLDIPLRHNSLLVMHAGCQEAFKHAVPPVKGGMDLFRVPRAARGALSDEERREVESTGYRERINLTFRHYRPDFAPLSSTSPAGYMGTPKCACGVPCTLRPDGRGRARASLGRGAGAGAGAAPDKDQDRDRDEMLFFWVCNAGAQNEGRGCGYWRVLDMEREGRGRWFAGRRENRREGDDVQV